MPKHTASAGPPADRLITIDILRALAAFAVMLAHLPFSERGIGSVGETTMVFPPSPFPEIFSYGRYGVHLFLVISGFCIHMRWARAGSAETTVDFVAFWKRRLKRIYPPYFVALVLSLLSIFGFYFVSRGGITGPVWEWFGYATAALFFTDMVLLLTLSQNLNGASHRVGNGPFWSLALEEQLYILYFPMLRLRRIYGWGVTLAVCAALTLVWRAVGILVFETPPVFWNVVGPAFWLPWAVGAWAAEVHTGKVHVPELLKSVPAFLALLAMTVGLHTWDGFPRALLIDTCVGLTSALLILSLMKHERERAKPFGPIGQFLARAGLWSFSVYLMHDLVYKITKQVLVELNVPFEIITILRLLSGLVAGYILYRLVEAPSLRWAQRQPVPLRRVGAPAAEDVDKAA